MFVWFLILKFVHVGAAMVFFGTGLGTAWYKFRADRSGDLRVIAWTQREVVRADWIYTVPSAILLPVTGLWMCYLDKIPLSLPWIQVGIGAYIVSGLLWLPAVYLQYKMKRLAEHALANSEPLPKAFFRAKNYWIALGIPSFSAALVALWAMAIKYMG